MEQDEEAIRQIVQSVEDGWNAGDGTAFAAPFAEDADYVIVDGRYIKGRAAIEGGHKGILSTIYRGSVNKYTVEDVRFIRPDVAVARVHAHLKLPAGGPFREAQARSTWVCAKDNGQWHIVAFQNSPISS